MWSLKTLSKSLLESLMVLCHNVGLLSAIACACVVSIVLVPGLARFKTLSSALVPIAHVALRSAALPLIERSIEPAARS